MDLLLDVVEMVSSDSCRRMSMGSILCNPRRMVSAEPNSPKQIEMHLTSNPLPKMEHSKSVSVTSPGPIGSSPLLPLPVKNEQSKREYRGQCRYRTGNCLTERSLKVDGRAHTLCEGHRTIHNENQRTGDRKRRGRKRALMVSQNASAGSLRAPPQMKMLREAAKPVSVDNVPMSMDSILTSLSTGQKPVMRFFSTPFNDFSAMPSRPVFASPTNESSKRVYRGNCKHKNGICPNERALKRSGKAEGKVHTLCEKHRQIHNMNQRRHYCKRTLLQNYERNGPEEVNH